MKLLEFGEKAGDGDMQHSKIGEYLFGFSSCILRWVDVWDGLFFLVPVCVINGSLVPFFTSQNV